jgi:hypothetical protein
MAAGRAATKAGHYAEAIAAFRRAASAPEDSGRASAELGYAQVLGGHSADAKKTLSSAWESSFETRLRSEVAYNLGLASDALHRPDEGLAWYSRAAALRPSSAVEAKLRGKSFCAADIDTKPVAATNHLGWLRAISDLKLDLGVAEGAEPKSEAAAEKLLCTEADCSTISVGPPDEGGPWSVERRLLRKLPTGELRISPVYFSDARPGWSMVCHQTAVVTVKREGSFFHVISGGTSWTKGLGTEKGEHCPSQSDDCVEDCFVTDFQRTDAFFDTVTLAQVVKVVQHTPCGTHCAGRERLLEAKVEGDDLTFKAMDGTVLRNPVRVAWEGGQVHLSGPPSCDRTIPLRAAK